MIPRGLRRVETRSESEMGQTLPKWVVRAMSGLPLLATELRTSIVVRFVPRTDMPLYSITSSARPSSDCGSVSPSTFAVFRLMISSILVPWMTGRSAGFSPLRIRPA